MRERDDQEYSMRNPRVREGRRRRESRHQVKGMKKEKREEEMKEKLKKGTWMTKRTREET